LQFGIAQFQVDLPLRQEATSYSEEAERAGAS
jgi:hypothetical protein